MIQIDRQKIYESHGYTFKNFVCLTEEEKMMILDWRNHENVRKEMVNKELISVENQTNSSFCRMEHPSNADANKCLERFKRFRA